MEAGVYLNDSQRAITAARMANLPGAAHINHLQMLQLRQQFPSLKQLDG